MKKVKALQAVHYGEDKYHKAGTTFNLNDDVAEELESQGIVEIKGDGPPDEPKSETKSDTKKAKEK